MKIKFHVLTAASIMMTALWDIAPCSLVEVDLMMEAVITSETSVNFYETTRRNIPQDCHLHENGCFPSFHYRTVGIRTSMNFISQVVVFIYAL
jgi:hypothetical protein